MKVVVKAQQSICHCQMCHLTKNGHVVKVKVKKKYVSVSIIVLFYNLIPRSFFKEYFLWLFIRVQPPNTSI